jgi:quercetin dioxygenase-like cupin family protein
VTYAIRKLPRMSPSLSAAMIEMFQQSGLDPQQWSTPPNFSWDWHSHPQHKRVYCLTGSGVFHTTDGDLTLSPGDAIDIPAGARHAATIGDSGICCVEVTGAFG